MHKFMSGLGALTLIATLFTVGCSEATVGGPDGAWQAEEPPEQNQYPDTPVVSSQNEEEGGGALLSGATPEVVAGGETSCPDIYTPNAVMVPWVSQDPSGKWQNNTCCGQAVATHIWGLHNNRQQLSAQDLYDVIDWTHDNIPGRRSNNYNCNYTGPDDVIAILEQYVGLSSSYQKIPWCNLAEYLDGEHVVILYADSQGTNTTQNFWTNTTAHWVILESIQGDTVSVNDPGRGSASQGDSRAYTTSSVRESFENRGGFALIVDLAPTSSQPPSCTDACQRGMKRCGGGGVSECITGPRGCTEWSDARACPIPGQTCEGSGSCTCSPVGRVCQGSAVYDSDSCGETNFVRSCEHGCYQGACEAAPEPSCRKRTCSSAGAMCGSLSDGCGGTLNCGSCGSSGQECGTNNRCECVAAVRTTCSGGHVYEEDSCGSLGRQIETCPGGCRLARCLQAQEVCSAASPSTRNPGSNEVEGGGEVLKLELISSSSCGSLRFRVSKRDGSSLGAGSYALRVGSGRHSGWVREQRYLSSPTSSFEFVTDHRGNPNSDAIKEFIATKEAANVTTSAHQAWWYSKFVRVQMSEEYN